MNDNQYGGGHLLAAFLGGAAAGAAVALLTAPHSGRENRERMKVYFDERRYEARRLPVAVRAAGDAAREAFVDAMHEEQHAS